MIRKAIIVVLVMALAAAGAGWIISHWYGRVATVFEWEPVDNQVVTVYFDRGSFLIRHICDVDTTKIRSRGPVFGKLELRTGLADRRHDRGSYARFVRIGSPFWIPFLVFGIYPAIAFIRGPLRRWHRRRKGLCVRCAYNLTGNMSGVCPECGDAIAG
ncbi:MAG: hypothetical protein JSU86_20505 [Phycisphaerales bacterium]|nr:MAG: hypothetical protein JSU86_20505 [Phycisphaerales bacterium]